MSRYKRNPIFSRQDFIFYGAFPFYNNLEFLKTKKQKEGEPF